MSYYEDERQRYRPAARERRRDSYDDDSTVYNNTRNNARSSALVKRRDSYDSADDEVTREFPPPDGRGGYIRETTIRKSGIRPARTRSYEDDRYYDDRYDDDRSYDSRRRSRGGHDDKRDRRSRRRSSDYSSRSRTPPPRERRKSKPEEALEALGLGGIAAALLGKKEDSRERNKSGGRDRAYSEDRYSSRRRSKSRGHGQAQLVQALKAAVLAGAGEAFLARKEPGGWSGEKGKRVLTAAFSAGGVDGLISHNKDPEDHKTRNAIGSAIAGLATSRIVNGERSKSRGRAGSPDSRRTRSQSRGGVGDLAAGGVIAAAAKKAYDNFRAQSQSQSEQRGRARSRSRSYSDDSRSPARGTSRRRSVSRGVARGLAAVGLSGAADKVDPSRRSRRNSDDYDDRYDGRRYNDYRDDDDVGAPRSGDVNSHARSVSQSRSDWYVAQRAQGPQDYSLDYGPHHYGDPDTDSDSDLGSSTDEEKERKKGTRKRIVTTGLATIATIHAGHSIYQAHERREKRKKAVKEGKITKEQAKKNQNRDRLQDAAAIGIAALGLKGAYSEWKEMKESRDEIKEEREKLARHHEKREARREKFYQLKEQGYIDNGRPNSMPDLHSPQPMAMPPMGSAFFNQRYDSQSPYGGNSGPGYGSGYGYGGGPPQSYQQPSAPLYYDDNPYASGYPPPPPNMSQMPYHPSNTMHMPPPNVGQQPQVYYAPQPPLAVGSRSIPNDTDRRSQSQPQQTREAQQPRRPDPEPVQSKHQEQPRQQTSTSAGPDSSPPVPTLRELEKE